MLSKILFLIVLLNQINILPIGITILNECDRETDIQLFEKNWFKYIKLNDDLIILNQNNRYEYKQRKAVKDVTVRFIVEGVQNKDYLVPKDKNYFFTIRDDGIYFNDISIEVILDALVSGWGAPDSTLIYSFE